MSTMALSLPADLYQSRAVASVSGMSGTAAGIGTIGAAVNFLAEKAAIKFAQ